MAPRYRAPALCGFAVALIGFLFVPTIQRSFQDWSNWALGDLHIDYAAGFVRRGLLGQTAYFLQRSFGIGTVDFFGYLFVVLTVLQVGLMTVLAWPLAAKRPALFLLTLLSPALLLFPAYDFGGYLRKDAFIVLGIMAHAVAVRGVRRGTLSNTGYEIFLCCLAPCLLICALIHETQIVFLPLHMAFVVLASDNFALSRRTIGRFLAIILPILVAAIAVLTHLGNAEMAQGICLSWKDLAPIDCGAIKAIGWGFSNLIRYDLRILANPSVLALYLLSLVLAMIPALAIREATRDTASAPSNRLAAMAIAPLLILFACGWDWGRWINLIAVSSTCLFLSTLTDLPPQPQARRVGVMLVVLATLGYLASWRLYHCCEITSLDGGLIASFLNSIAAVFGAL